jgi:DNA-binding response OmpR family regulator
MSKKRILIVDDDMVCARILKTGLEKSGDYEVLIELHATRAVAATQQFQPHLILLDVCLIDGDGGDVAFKLRSDPKLRDIAVVFLTSLVSERETRDDGTLVGTIPFLAKPVRLERVIACIEKHLGMTDSHKQVATKM